MTRLHPVVSFPLNFSLARKIQPFISLVDREVEFLCTNDLIVLPLFFFVFFSHSYFFVRKNPGSCDCTEIRTHVTMSEALFRGYQLNHRGDRFCFVLFKEKSERA